PLSYITPPTPSSTLFPYTTLFRSNRLEAEARNIRQGRLADQLTRMDFIILDELGYLPFAQSGGQLLFHLVSRLYERASIIVTTRSEEHTSELQSLAYLVCRLLLEK